MLRLRWFCAPIVIGVNFLMRIIVMGSGPFAVPSASALLREKYEIPLVVTKPSAPSPKRPLPRPVADWALQNRIPVYEPPNVNALEAISTLEAYRADLFFVCDYGQILAKRCLAAARLGGVNLHGSLLPRHRGAAPVQWCLLSGDRRTGVTAIHMTPKLDAGPILAQRTTNVLPDENAAQLLQRLSLLGVEATLEAVHRLESWDGMHPLGSAQDPGQVTRAPRLEKAHGVLDFRLPADYLVRLVRACQPWPGTFADLLVGKGPPIRLLVRSARSLLKPDAGTLQPFPEDEPFGTIDLMDSSQLGLGWDSEWKTLLGVKADQGMVLINRVQPAGKREMPVADFIRGHPFSKGWRFTLPEPPLAMLSSAPPSDS